jgi:hypothetical protein
MKKTITESELRRLVEEGKTHREIGDMLGRVSSAVAAACAVLGINSGPKSKYGKRRPAAHDTDAYLSDLRRGLTMQELGAKHGMHAMSIRQALLRAGLPTCARKLLRQEAEKQAA